MTWNLLVAKENSQRCLFFLRRNQLVWWSLESEIKSSVIEEMEKKIKSLSSPKGVSIRPVLIHINGVSKAVIESELFNDIVDFSAFFSEL